MTRWFPLLPLVFLTSAGPQEWKPEEGFTLLFNGKDLSGWKYGSETLDGKAETEDKRFQIVDGAIVANEKDSAGKGGIKNLYTVASFDNDFRVKLEFRAGPKADSGVYVRGPQLQVRDFLRLNQQKQLTKFKNDEWNELDISVKAGVVTTTVNGKAVGPKDVLEVTVKDGRPDAKLNGQPVDVTSVQVNVGAVADCLVNGEPLSPREMSVPAKGPIGLQAESGKFEFRRIRLKTAP